MKKVAFYSLGCKVNQYESEAVSSIFQEEGYEVVSYDTFADVYVINTCTVTGLSDRKSRQIIRRAKKINPDAIVAAMGCYTQIKPEEVSKIPDVDIIIGTNDRHKIAKLCDDLLVNRKSKDVLDSSNEKIISVSDSFKYFEFEELKVSTFKERQRAFLKIQDGCTQFCSYCIIPYARGPVRSRKPDNVKEEILRLVDAGFKEFVLTGIHVASYGRDLRDINLVGLIDKILKIDGVERLRLSSIEPGIIDDEFVDVVSSSPKMCRHFHLSLQSGCNETLKRMNRKYTKEQYYEGVLKLRNALEGVAITTDIIVGFPGETDEEFNETLEFAKKVDFSKIHVFKFSPREGTPAATMPNQIDDAVKELRSNKLITLSEEMSHNFIKNHQDKIMPVLFEKYNNEDLIEGHTDNYIRVLCNISNFKGNDLPQPGDIIDVKIKEAFSDYAEGIIC